MVNLMVTPSQLTQNHGQPSIPHAYLLSQFRYLGPIWPRQSLISGLGINSNKHNDYLNVLSAAPDSNLHTLLDWNFSFQRNIGNPIRETFALNVNCRTIVLQVPLGDKVQFSAITYLTSLWPSSTLCQIDDMLNASNAAILLLKPQLWSMSKPNALLSRVEQYSRPRVDASLTNQPFLTFL